jgi:hypothetical protein
MKRMSIPVMSFVLTLAVSALLLSMAGPPAQAQSSCTPFRGIVQGILPSPSPFDPSDVWGGTIYLNLNGEVLSGPMNGNDGAPAQHGGRGGVYKAYLCPKGLPCADSITYEVPNSVFGFAPGKVGLGEYKGNSARIISGTGRFEGATGNLNSGGPYVLWEDATSPFGVRGRWNGELAGSLCGVR